MVEKLRSDTEKDPESYIKLLQSLQWLVVSHQLQGDYPAAESDLKRSIWKSIAKYPDPSMRFTLAEICLKNIETLNEKQEYQNLILVKNSFKESLKLPMLLLMDLKKNGADISELAITMKANDRNFKDGRIMKAFMDSMTILKKINILTPQEKANLMNRILNSEDTENLRADLLSLQGIIQCGGAEKLKQNLTQNLNALYRESFSSIIPITFSSSDFSLQLEDKFLKKRSSEALLTYAGRMKGLPENLRCLGSLVDEVLSDTFKVNRYEGSEHLNKIFEIRPDLKEKWAKDTVEELKLEKMETTEKENTPVDFLQFFYQKIIDDKHINPDSYPFLTRFLGGEDVQSELKSYIENPEFKRKALDQLEKR